MMQAITYQLDTDRFEFKAVERPQLETPFDVMVEVQAVGLNPVDAKVNHWYGMVEKGTKDFIGGLDVSGVIVAKGSQVNQWNIGDKVLYHGNMRRRQGGFADLAVHDSRTLTCHPNISTVEAAASPCAGWTAYQAVEDKLTVSKRNSVLIYGATGGVGSYALQLCKYYQVNTIIAVCSENNFDYARSLGATHCCDYRDNQLVNKINAIVGEAGIDSALDCIGGSAQELISSLLGFNGQLVELVSTFDSSKHQNAFDRALSFHQVSLGSGHVYGQTGYSSITHAGKTLNQLLEKEIIQSPQISTIKLKDIPEVLYELRQGHSRGKFVAQLN